MKPDISIVIPVFNESGNAAPLAEEIAAALDLNHAVAGAYEVVFVDDGSTDATPDDIEALLDDGRIRLLRQSARRGMSAAIRQGVMAARADWIVTLDGDGQNDPADIPRLLQLAWTRGRTDKIIICGVRVNRRDTVQKRLASTCANAIRRFWLHDGAPDTGCALKIFRRDAYLALPFFNSLHRFMPALFAAHGHEVLHTPVNDRPRLNGQSKSDILGRGLRGLYDLFGVGWLIRRTPKTAGCKEVREDAIPMKKHHIN